MIIGSGPVGLCLAIDLAYRDIPSVIVERTDGAVKHPKAGSLSNRTMEFCRRWGIAEDIRQCGFPRDYGLSMVFCTSIVGHNLGTHVYPSMDADVMPPQSPEKKQRSPQLFFDPILASWARKSGKVTFLYRTEYRDLQQDDNGVRVSLRDLVSDRDYTIEADYVVGCDGAASGVREALGIASQGRKALDYSVAVLVKIPGLRQAHAKGDAERYIFVGPTGTWGNLTAVNGSDLWRLTVLGAQDHIDMGRFDAASWMRKALGTVEIPFEIIDTMPWRRASLVAERYGQGRVFIAGDSAHTMSPTGGFGFNTGAGDAIDLSWKLEAALRGWAGDQLLPSYSVERQPIGVRNVGVATQNYFHLTSAANCQNILDESPEGLTTRDRIGAEITAATMTEWETIGVNLGYRYENSPICIADGTPMPADEASVYTQTSRPGHRAPHAWLADGSSIIDAFGRGFVLLTFPGSENPAALIEAANARDVPLRVVHMSEEHVVALYERKYVLVRPDGHVAWRSDRLPSNAMEIIDRVRGASGKPI